MLKRFERPDLNKLSESQSERIYKKMEESIGQLRHRFLDTITSDRIFKVLYRVRALKNPTNRQWMLFKNLCPHTYEEVLADIDSNRILNSLGD